LAKYRNLGFMKRVLFLFLATVLAACEPAPPPPAFTESTNAAGELTRSYPQTHMRFQAGARMAQVRSKTFNITGSGSLHRWQAQGMQATLPDLPGGGKLELQCGAWTWLQGDPEMTFSDGVVLDVPGGQLEADMVKWTLGEHLLRADTGTVRLFLPQGIIQGEGLEADIMLHGFRLGRVTGVMAPESQP
jgi:hypothetical protein